MIRIWLGGGDGYIVWQGTQHNPTAPRLANNVPKRPGATIAVIGDLKKMTPKWIKGVSFYGYGTTLNVGIGVPIPILNEEILKYTTVKDEEIFAAVVDYSEAYPQGKPEVLEEVNYAQLKSGEIEVKGKKVPTSAISSYSKALEIANILKDQIKKGDFLLSEPVELLPGPETGITFKPLKERPI